MPRQFLCAPRAASCGVVRPKALQLRARSRELVCEPLLERTGLVSAMLR